MVWGFWDDILDSLEFCHFGGSLGDDAQRLTLCRHATLNISKFVKQGFLRGLERPLRPLQTGVGRMPKGSYAVQQHTRLSEGF